MALKIKTKPNIDLDLMALYGEDDAQPVAGSTVKARKAAAGKKPVRGTDRRFKHGAARNKQYNTNVTEEIFDLVARLMDQHDLTKAEFTERAIRHYAEHLKKGGK